jgi:hypothetical protein
MVQTRNRAVAIADGDKTVGRADRRRDVATESKLPRDDMPKLFACLVLVGISWAMVVCNIIINIRNGQRLSIDDHGWLMNGVIVGTLSLAPTAAVAFAGYHWARGRKALGFLAILAAAPLGREGPGRETAQRDSQRDAHAESGDGGWDGGSTRQLAQPTLGVGQGGYRRGHTDGHTHADADGRAGVQLLGVQRVAAQATN